VEGGQEEVSDLQIVSHKTDVERAVEKAMHKAARMIGGSAVGHAVDACPVDTGLLRNSITFAIGGEAPAILNYQSDDKDKSGEFKTGHYDGEAPEDDDGEITVYVGTNVEYAPYQELGTVNMDARPFLRPAMEDFKREYEQIVEKCCKEIR
jgi:HK97 gp10 family phage protein